METAKDVINDFDSISKMFMDSILIFGPNIAYISQISKFRKLNSSQGFSKKICLLILIANILRIFFWIGKRFDITLLYQSIVAIIMQLFLLNECLAVSKDNYQDTYINTDSFENMNTYNTFEQEKGDSSKLMIFGENSLKNEKAKKDLNTTKIIKEREFTDNGNFSRKECLKSKNIQLQNNLEETEYKKESKFSFPIENLLKTPLENILKTDIFWDWPHFIEYVLFCLFFSIFVAVIYSIFGIHNKFFIEVLGFISLIIESMIGVPQTIENYKNKSTKNLSQLTFLLWINGDILKTLYFLKFNSPLQFILMGFTQVAVDSIIIFQINYYN